MNKVQSGFRFEFFHVRLKYVHLFVGDPKRLELPRFSPASAVERSQDPRISFSYKQSKMASMNITKCKEIR